MATPTAAETAAKLKEIMAASPGVSEITVDGINVQMDEALKTLKYWERKAAIEDGTIATASSIDLSNMMS